MEKRYDPYNEGFTIEFKPNQQYCTHCDYSDVAIQTAQLNLLRKMTDDILLDFSMIAPKYFIETFPIVVVELKQSDQDREVGLRHFCMIYIPPLLAADFTPVDWINVIWSSHSAKGYVEYWKSKMVVTP